MFENVRKRGIASTLAVAGALVVVPAAPALADCAMYPGTNPVSVTVGGEEVASVPGTGEGGNGICYSITGNPDPEVDQDLTITPGVGCGIPCFVVAWGGVTTTPFTVHVTLFTAGYFTAVERTFGGDSGIGSFCINAGMACP